MALDRVYLVDSSIYVFRAWFTLPDSIRDIHDAPVNALYGFADFVANFLEETKPSLIAFVFDESLASSFRNELYPQYKANRESAPQELKNQFRLCRELINALGIFETAHHQFEADDLIGTLATHMRAHGHPIAIVSADKDFAQLIEENDELWDYARNFRFTSKTIADHFGVRPSQIADQLAIAGDKVDNIPGIPGVGRATAARLLKKFGSLENLIQQHEQITNMKIRGAPRLKQLVKEHSKAIVLYKKLTEIKCDIQLDPFPSLRRSQINHEKFFTLLEQFGFGNVRKQRWQKILNAL